MVIASRFLALSCGVRSIIAMYSEVVFAMSITFYSFACAPLRPHPLPVQHAAPARDAAEVPFFPADGQVVIFDGLYRKTVLRQPDGGFFKETELRGFVLIVHCEVLLVSKKIGRSILKMLRPVDGLSCEMKKGAYLMASTKPTNRRLKDRMKF